MKIVYFGTPEFAASQLEAILDAGYEVPAVVTTPDRPAGRGLRQDPGHEPAETAGIAEPAAAYQERDQHQGEERN